MDRYVVQIRKKRKLHQFGFLAETAGAFLTGALRHATAYNSVEEAETAATTFMLMHTEYLGRAVVRKVERHMNQYV